MAQCAFFRAARSAAAQNVRNIAFERAEGALAKKTQYFTGKRDDPEEVAQTWTCWGQYFTFSEFLSGFEVWESNIGQHAKVADGPHRLPRQDSGVDDYGLALEFLYILCLAFWKPVSRFSKRITPFKKKGNVKRPTWTRYWQCLRIGSRLIVIQIRTKRRRTEYWN